MISEQTPSKNAKIELEGLSLLRIFSESMKAVFLISY